MPYRNVRIQLEKFNQATKSGSVSALLILGRILIKSKVSRRHANAYVLVRESILQKITQHDISLLWRHVPCEKECERFSNDLSISLLYDTVIMTFLGNINWLSKMSYKDIATYAKSDIYYFVSFIALVRLHLFQKGSVDPFVDIDCQLYKMEASQFQLYEIKLVMSQCSSLPVTWIVQFCIDNPQNADQLYCAISNHSQRFEIGREIACINQSLNKHIRGHWMNEKKHGLLTANELASLNKSTAYLDFNEVLSTTNRFTQKENLPRNTLLTNFFKNLFKVNFTRALLCTDAIYGSTYSLAYNALITAQKGQSIYTSLHLTSACMTAQPIMAGINGIYFSFKAFRYLQRSTLSPEVKSTKNHNVM